MSIIEIVLILQIDGLMLERHNSIANTMELVFFLALTYQNYSKHTLIYMRVVILLVILSFSLINKNSGNALYITTPW